MRNLFQVNQQVYILADPERHSDDTGFPSVVLDFHADGILLLKPTDLEDVLAADQKIGLRFLHKQNLFQAASLVLAARTVPIPHVVVQWPEKVEKIQRRAHVRLKTAAPIEIFTDRDLSHRLFRGFICDISAGGLSVDVPVSFPEYEEVVLRIELDEAVEMEGRVIRRQELKKDPHKLRLSIRFEGLSSRDEDRIMLFIFNEQVIRRRKGLL